jgi:hypothetical protein
MVGANSTPSLAQSRMAQRENQIVGRKPSRLGQRFVMAQP